MVISDFMKEVRKLQATWVLTPKGFIRTSRGDCPITALAKAKIGGKFKTSQPEEAGVKLGLSESEIYAIIASADGYTSEDSSYDASLRLKMLKLIKS